MQTRWSVGDRLLSPYDPELGIGEVRAIDGRFLEVFFPDTDRTLTLTAASGLERVTLEPGRAARLIASGEQVHVAALEEGRFRLTDGRVVDARELWPLATAPSPIDALAAGRGDALEAFRNRIDGMRLAELREAGGLGSFLGGRIELFAHQLYTALQAVRADPVRWLLADEVGLGKTIEASLILSALVRTGRSTRAIVVAPDTLAVQWLGELYRKFHQVFSLLDDERLSHTAREFGPEFNPFVAHRNSVVSFERLASDSALREHALACEPDLVVFDEAHRLCAPELHAQIGPLVRQAHHALLLTATPLAAGLRGFYTLLELLHPAAFDSYASFERAIASGGAVLPCTSAVRRQDLGGFPPRHPVPVDLEAASDDPRSDPRARWIAQHVARWRERGEKALVFVGALAQLEALRTYLERTTETNVAVFHEALALEERDVRLARFQAGSDVLLLCSEAGAEGRNFQFCQRMIHYDLPSDPIRLEQRIGRLDRIGRRIPVEIVYFRPAGARPDLAGLYERLGLFATPSAGIDAALGGVREAVEQARARGTDVDVDALERSVEQARTSAARAAPRAFYPDAYEPSKAAAVLALVPPDLEERTREFCVEAARQLGLKVVPKGGTARYYLELTGKAGGADFGLDRATELATADWGNLLTRVDSLPGVQIHALPGYTSEVRFLGTFDRAEAIQHQSLAFFASGQMLVEGLLLELEDGPRGRSALLELSGSGTRGSGLLCIYKDGARWSALALDLEARLRPEWAELLLSGLSRARPFALPWKSAPPEWAAQVRALAAAAERAEPHARLCAAAFFRLR